VTWVAECPCSKRLSNGHPRATLPRVSGASSIASSLPTDEALAWLSGVKADVAALTPEQRAEIRRRAERFERELAELETGRHLLQSVHAAE
jgi:hypothetical protein